MIVHLISSPGWVRGEAPLICRHPAGGHHTCTPIHNMVPVGCESCSPALLRGGVGIHVRMNLYSKYPVGFHSRLLSKQIFRRAVQYFRGKWATHKSLRRTWRSHDDLLQDMLYCICDWNWVLVFKRDGEWIGDGRDEIDPQMYWARRIPLLF